MSITQKSKKKSKSNWLFLFIVVIIFVIFWFFYPQWAINVLNSFFQIFVKVFWILILVYFIIFLFSLFLDKNNKLIKYFSNKSKIWKLFFAVVSWIISAWPLYIRYPILKEMLQKWMLSEADIVAFIYARAIKIPFFPVMVYFFGWWYTIIFYFYFVCFFFCGLFGV